MLGTADFVKADPTSALAAYLRGRKAEGIQNAPRGMGCRWLGNEAVTLRVAKLAWQDTSSDAQHRCRAGRQAG